MAGDYQKLWLKEHPETCEACNVNKDKGKDCDDLICSQCTNTVHGNHVEREILNKENQRKKELKTFIGTVKERIVGELSKKTHIITEQMDRNEKSCDSEVSKLKKHYDAIVSKLNEIKTSYEKILKNKVEEKNNEIRKKKLVLVKKKEKVDNLAKFLEEKYRTMSDYSLIDNLRDGKNLISNNEIDMQNKDFSARYKQGRFNDRLLESIVGHVFDLNDINVTMTDSFQYGSKPITVLELLSEDSGFVSDLESDYIVEMNITNKKEENIPISYALSVCVTQTGDAYITGLNNETIICLSSTGYFSIAFVIYPLTSGGICVSMENGLLVTLGDTKSSISEWYEPDKRSRRLVRHVTLTGDVIREYEYHEDGKTRLFTVPWRVAQNGTTDICVVNRTSISTGELMILSFSGSIKSVYTGNNLVKVFSPINVVCDSYCNIIVSDMTNSQVHLLRPEGEFVKYLLTEKDITHPCSMSLYKSTLWVGDANGLLKVYQYET